MHGCLQVVITHVAFTFTQCSFFRVPFAQGFHNAMSVRPLEIKTKHAWCKESSDL